MKKENWVLKTLRYLCLTCVIVIGFIAIVGTGGGGGSGGGGDSTPSVPKGTFVDSVVEGVEYKTATQSGLTDSAGIFSYQTGESITFSLGGIVLGQAIAKTLMSPIDLINGAVDETDPTVTNISRLLQSLDMDGNLDNGITISEEIRNEIEGRPIDFTLSTADFGNDPDVQALFDTLNALGVFTDRDIRTLRSVGEAQSHLRETLESRR